MSYDALKQTSLSDCIQKAPLLLLHKPPLKEKSFFFQLTLDQEEFGEIQFGYIFQQSGPGSLGHFHLAYIYKTVHLAVVGPGRPETLTRLKKQIFTISPSPSVERLARSYA